MFTLVPKKSHDCTLHQYKIQLKYNLNAIEIQLKYCLFSENIIIQCLINKKLQCLTIFCTYFDKRDKNKNPFSLQSFKKRRDYCFVTNFFPANFELFRKFNLKSIHIFTSRSRSVEKRKKERKKGKIFYEER